MPPEPLIARYRGLICDLDGVVYRGASAVPGSVETLNHLIADDTGVVFATNNASRPPDAVGEHLRELGLARRGWSVVTSSQAAAAYLADRLPTRTPVFAVGGPGVAQALAEVGLVPVGVRELAETHVTAVVQGLGVDVQLARACGGRPSRRGGCHLGGHQSRLDAPNRAWTRTGQRSARRSRADRHDGDTACCR